MRNLAAVGVVLCNVVPSSVPVPEQLNIIIENGKNAIILFGSSWQSPLERLANLPVVSYVPSNCVVKVPDLI